MMAAVTERLEFMQSVYVLPMRDPFHVAKAVGTLAIMSGHRVSLGIGLGWMSDEFRLLSVPFEKRARRMDEMVEVMRKLWTGGIVEHHGDFYDFAPLSMAPGVGREIPIIVGGVSEAAMRRTARLGAAWAPAYLDTEELRAGIAKIHEYRREYGSDDRPLRVYTSPTDVLEPDDFRRAEEAGVTDFFGTPWIDFEGEIDYTKLVRGVPLDMILDGIKRFADDVIAKIS
jgi:probable F420-dependent oxidoreductase